MLYLYTVAAITHNITNKYKTMTKIKMQCRDKNGNILAYHQDVENINDAIKLKDVWESMYVKHAHVITINFFHS